MDDEDLTLFEMRTSHLSDSELEQLKIFMQHDLSDANHLDMEYWLAMRESNQLDKL